MFGKREVDSQEYKRLALQIFQLEQRQVKVEALLEAYDQRLQSFSGRFYRHIRDDPEEEAPKSKPLNKPFSPFGL